MYAFKGVAMLIVCALVLDVVKTPWIHWALSWLGRYSLELYLLNLVTIQAVELFSLESWAQAVFSDMGGYVLYGGVLVVGIMFAAFFGEISRKICLKYSSKNRSV